MNAKIKPQRVEAESTGISNDNYGCDSYGRFPKEVTDFSKVFNFNALHINAIERSPKQKQFDKTQK